MNAVIETRRIDSLKYDPDNVRLHTDRNLDAIKASYKRFGQQRPILVTEDGTVIAGNAQLAAAKSLEWEEILVQITSLSDAKEIRAYAIADNRTSEFGEWDFEGLSAQLKDLQELEFDFDSVGFDQKELDRIFENTKQVEVPELKEEEPKDQSKPKTTRKTQSGTIQLTIKESADAQEVKQAVDMINAVVVQFSTVFNERSVGMK